MIALDLAHKKSFCVPLTKEVRWLNPISMGWESICFPQKLLLDTQQLAKIYDPLTSRESKQLETMVILSFLDKYLLPFLPAKFTHSPKESTANFLSNQGNLYIRLDMASLLSDNREPKCLKINELKSYLSPTQTIYNGTQVHHNCNILSRIQ